MIVLRNWLLVAALLLPLGALAQLPLPGYRNDTLQDFHVLVEELAYSQDSARAVEALTLLDAKLAEELTFCMHPDIQDTLLATPIFVDWQTSNGAAVYHPSRAWLVANGYPPGDPVLRIKGKKGKFPTLDAEVQPRADLSRVVRSYCPDYFHLLVD